MKQGDTVHVLIMKFDAYRCCGCGYIWTSARSIIFWIKYGCPKCHEHLYICFYPPRCPDCNQPLKPKLERDSSQKIGQRVKYWECTSPPEKCLVMEVRYTRNGVKIKRATAA